MRIRTARARRVRTSAMSGPRQETGLLDMIAAGLDKIDQGVTIFDRDLRLVFANKPLLRLLDLPAQMIVRGAVFADILRHNALRGEYGPGDPEEQVALRVQKAREFKKHTLERTRPNGVVLRVSGWPLPEGGFATIYTDVTDQRRREASLQREVLERTEDLRRNEARLRLIANEAPAGIAYLDHGEVFRFANRRFARAYGKTPEDVVGLPTTDLLPAEMLRAAQPYFARAQAGEPAEFEHEATLVSGRRLSVRTYLRPEGEHAGGARGFYVLSIDVDRQKRATEALLQAQKMEALGQLSSGIAHDFNNLLTVILGNLRALADRVDDVEARETMLAPALRATRRGAELTRRLLSVARRQPLAPTAVDAVETANVIAALLRPSLGAGVVLSVGAEDEPLTAYVDRAQLENALLNLAMNARDAVGDSGRIEIALARREIGRTEADALDVEPGAFVQIRLSDDGVGIPQERLSRVFEPFYSTKAGEAGSGSGSGSGSGLGLAIVYAFLKSSGGAVTVESAPGEGAAFTILAPATDAAPAAPAAPSAPEHAARFDGALALLVDDDCAVRQVLRRELVAAGFAVLEASTGAEALALAEMLDALDVVLSDVAMPGAISGVALAERLAERRPGVPVVLMTGHDREKAEAATQTGAARAVLQKPIERATLTRALADAIGPRRRRSEETP